jgi:hypothetical protein
MWQDILNLAISNGLFAVLFCLLLVYTLKDGKKRETKYQETIDQLVEKFGLLVDIKQDNEQIKQDNARIIADNEEIKKKLEI